MNKKTGFVAVRLPERVDKILRRMSREQDKPISYIIREAIKIFLIKEKKL